MKKKLCFGLALVLSLAILLPCFFAGKNTTKQAAVAASVESEYLKTDSFDLIPAEISTNISNGITENAAPYNTEANSRYSGSCITPTAGNYAEFHDKIFPISRTDGVSGYIPEEDDAIFMWVYLLDKMSYTLKISLVDSAGNKLTWQFDHQEIYSYGSGWKLIQLNLSDFNEEKFSEKNYLTLHFSYYSSAEDGDEPQDDVYTNIESKTNERFSFYHVFVSKNNENDKRTGMVYSLEPSFFEFSDQFNISNSVFIGDKIKIQNVKEIFKTLYIGKYDLSNYASSGNYYWSLSFKSPSGDKATKKFGDYLNFYEQGYYVFTIQLYSSSDVDPLLNEDISIYCDELTLGGFVFSSSYSIKDNEKILITFKLAKNVNVDGEYSVTINNNIAEIDTSYIENGVLYVVVSGLSAGSATLDISAKAKSEFGEKTQNLVSSATITIKSAKSGVDIFQVILWVTFACFCVGIIIYLSISVVKSRKNDVK